MSAYKNYGQWVTHWLERKEQLVKKSTYSAYVNIVVNHLIPKFGNWPLKRFTEERIQEYALLLLRHGRLDGSGGLSERSARDIIVVLKNSLREAMKLKLLPAAEFNIRFPNRQERYKINVLSKIVQQRLIQAIYLNLSNKSAGILLALYTGLRIGEICGLKWGDIDFENKLLHVRRTLQRVYRKNMDGSGQSQIIISEPKTHSSKRSVPLSSLLIPVLRRLSSDNADNFFLSGTVKSVEVRTFRTFFENFLRKNNIDKVNFHALRHTFATRCIEAGGDCKTVSELLGHATVNMTLNLYVHPQIEQKRKCVELLNDFF